MQNSNSQASTLKTVKDINLSTIADEIERNIEASVKKNQGYLSIFRQVDFSSQHLEIRQALLENLSLTLKSGKTDEELLKEARSIFFNALEKSYTLHQRQTMDTLKKLALKKQGEAVAFDTVTPLEIGITVATDQHFILENYYKKLCPNNPTSKFAHIMRCSNNEAPTIKTIKAINLSAIANMIKRNIDASYKKNQYLSIFRQVDFSDQHLEIRQNLLGKLYSILTPDKTDEELLKEARSIFFDAMEESRYLHQLQTMDTLKKLSLKKDEEEVDFDTVTPFEIGDTVATDQHFILENYYKELTLKNTTYKFIREKSTNVAFRMTSSSDID